jgi:ribosomal peptide maturation radical SAM protein 1
MNLSPSLSAASDDQGAERRTLRIGLVNMPFGSTKFPSMQHGLLQAILAERGFAATSHYLNLHFAARFGWELHEFLSWYAPRLAGEWLFARAAFGEQAPNAADYLGLYGDKLGPLGGFTKYLVQLRERDVPAFIEECLGMVPWDQYDVVGFGSVFEQNCAALALARRIKERYPAVLIVFGGANFEDEMGLEYVRTLSWIDYAVIGEGDEVFPALLERLAAGRDMTGLRGVAWRADGGDLRFEGRAQMVSNLDALPTPDYADFFTTAARLQRPSPDAGFNVQAPFESARGCWWGAKHQCTFCGLNGATMAYRSKTPGRVIEEIDELARRYDVHSFGAVDNILDHRYVTEVFGRLAERGAGYQLFYEVKANLTREQLCTMARGGMRRVQPGIESLSTHMLALMEKGTTALQNVRFLKWAHYYGIEVVWNLLLGFPGERPEDYEQQLAIMPLLRHLPPAVAVTAIHLDRFSPYFDRADELGIFNVRPDPAYATVYPSDLDPSRIAYYFEHDAPDTLPVEAHAPLYAGMKQWYDAWQAPSPPELRYEWEGDRLQIRDSRWSGPARLHAFSGAAAQAYEFCGTTTRSLARIADHLRERGLDADGATVRRDLDVFTAAGLMLEEHDRFLSLALPAGRDAQEPATPE